MKIITIEGTDCSGKETQSKLLLEKLEKDGYKVKRISFPQYHEPTGKIVGGAYLGKPEIGECLFLEGAVNVDPIVASLYYAADRRYTFIKSILCDSKDIDVLILDRYTSSNLGHQGSKIADEKKQDEFFDAITLLEYGICELPVPDLTIFLHMPLEAAKILKKNRTNLDQHELSEQHLLKSERTYLRLSQKYDWKYICCLNGEFNGLESIKTPTEISDEIYSLVQETLKKKDTSKLKMTLY